MMRKRVSIKDIAQKAGVSTALVSYVLNGKDREARIGKEMVRKVKKIANEMGYQPNLIARGLKFGKTKTLGLIVADISNPFFAMLARNIEQEAQKNGYTVLFGSSDEQLDKSENLINTFLNRQVDGLIITPVENSQSQIKELTAKGVPFVLMDRGLKNIDANIVVTDNHLAVYNAVKLLIKNGYRKIGMIAYNTTLTHMQERIQGYKDALKDTGVRFRSKWLIQVPYQDYKEHIAVGISSLLDKSPNSVDALVFATNSISVQALKDLYTKGLLVPDDLGLICFDESDTFEYFYTSITYIKQNLSAISEMAVRSLVKNMNSTHPKILKVVVPSAIVVGKSSAKRK